jgi:hypothetical protein
MEEPHLLQLIDDFLAVNPCLESDLTCATVCNRLFSSMHERHPTKRIYGLAIEARDYIWEALHSKSWNSVDSGYKDAFSLLSIILVAVCSVGDSVSDESLDQELLLSRKIAFIDSGILLGSNRYRRYLLNLIDQDVDLKKAKCAVQSYNKFTPQKTVVERRATPSFLSRTLSKSRRCSPIAFRTSPDLVYFYNHYFFSRKAVVLGSCMDDWSALTKWKRLDYYVEGTYEMRLKYLIQKQSKSLFREILSLLLDTEFFPH